MTDERVIWDLIESAWRGREEKECVTWTETNGKPEGKQQAKNFRELEALVQRCGKRLASCVKGDLRGHVVICAVPSSLELIAAYLAIVRYGGIFCPVSYSSIDSFSHLMEVVTRVEASVVIVTELSLREVRPSSIPFISTQELFNSHPHERDEQGEPRQAIDPLAAAHLIFTSASTSDRSKAVLCDQRGSVSSHTFRNEFVPHELESDITGCNLFGIWDAVASLAAGCKICMISDAVFRNVELLSRAIVFHEITRIMLTPSLLAALVRYAHDSESKTTPLFSQLRVITLCGEVADGSVTTLASKLMRPEARIVNLFSLSECHDVAICDLTQGSDGGLIVFPNVDVFVLDESGHMCAPDQWGIVHIAGIHLAKEYFLDEGATATAFQTLLLPGQNQPVRAFNSQDVGMLDSDGKLRIKGRQTSADEVNVRGFRISLGECESTLRGVGTGVLDCAIVPVKNNNDGLVELVGCVVLEPEAAEAFGRNIWQLETRKAMKASRLPSACVPGVFLLFDSFPVKESSGKRDVQALRATVTKRLQEQQQNSNPTITESKVVSLFEQVTRSFPYPGETSDFFSNGGNSISLISLLERLREEVKGCSDLTLSSLLNDPTPRGVLAKLAPTSPEYPAEDTWSGTETSVDLLKRVAHHARFIPDVSSRQVVCPDVRRVALVTGASGFVGSFLVANLLKASVWSKVYLLVRRPFRNLSDYCNKMREEHHVEIRPNSSRLCLIEGDVTQPLCGLQASTLRGLTTVFHCAGKIDIFSNYHALEPVNVLGTMHVLQLAAAACDPFLPQVVHVSSSAALPPVGTNFVKGKREWTCETGILPLASYESMYTREVYEGTYEGYAQSKWVAEQLVADALEKGFQAVVARPSVIAPPSYCSTEEVLHVLGRSHSMVLLDVLATSLSRLRCLPSFQVPEPTLSFICVDHFAQRVAMIPLLAFNLCSSSCSGSYRTVVHLAERPMNVSSLCRQLQECLPHVAKESFEVWSQRFRTCVSGVKWRTLLSASHGLEGVFGLCELPLEPSP